MTDYTFGNRPGKELPISSALTLWNCSSYYLKKTVWRNGQLTSTR